MNTKLHIGLDVHKNSIVAACAHADGGEPAHYGKWGGSNLAAGRGLLKLLKKFGLGKGDVRICYDSKPRQVLAGGAVGVGFPVHRRGRAGPGAGRVTDFGEMCALVVAYPP